MTDTTDTSNGVQKSFKHVYADVPRVGTLSFSLPVSLEYIGEFGAELVLFLPFCCWLSGVGLLADRRIITYRGMRCFYDDLHCLGIVEKPSRRAYLSAKHRPGWLPVKNEHDFDGRGRSPLHHYPDLRNKFLPLPLRPEIGTRERPLLIIHNKYSDEWRSGPVNHISIAALEKLFAILKKDFTVVYTRHGMVIRDSLFEDHAAILPFDDRALLQRHPEVLCFDDVYAAHCAQGGAQDLNTFKNVLYSRCYRFISSQGGGAHHIAMFSGSLLAVLHRRGMEENWAYANGYYGFMAAVPPLRAICRTEEELIRASVLFADSTVAEDRLLLSAASGRLLSQLSPSTIARRRHHI